MEKSNNYNSIDLFKLIMAICVVAIHTNPLCIVDIGSDCYDFDKRIC